jgi:hypothetical protein
LNIRSMAISTPVSSLPEQVAQLVDDRPYLLSGRARIDWLRDFQRTLNQAHGIFLSVLAEVVANRDYELEGALSAVPWMARTLHLDAHQAERLSATALRLRDFELTRDALDAGEVTVDQVVRLTRTLEQVDANHLPRVVDEQGELEPTPEQILIGSAREESPRQFRNACRTLEVLLRPEQALRESNAALDREWVRLSPTFEGRWVLNGEFASENGNLLATALDSLLRAPAAGDLRGGPERRAEAFMELIQHALAAGDLPTSGGERPHLALVTDVGSLCDVPGSGPALLLPSGEPVPGKLAQKLACDCWITPIVTDQRGDVLHVGRRRRTFDWRQRQALVLRDGGCCFPGCDRPPKWTEGHHLLAWWEGGGTDLDNAALLCRRHHTMVHQRGWTLTRDPDTGHFSVQPP